MSPQWTSIVDADPLEGKTDNFELMQASGCVWAVDRRSAEVFRLNERAWDKTINSLQSDGETPAGGPSDDWRFATSGDTHFLVDGAGVLWSADARNGRWSGVDGGEAAGDVELDRRSTIIWETARQGLICVTQRDGGVDTWALAGGTWKRVDRFESTRWNTYRLVDTPHGVFASADGQLLRLQGDEWLCVGHDAAWTVTELAWDPRRSALIAVAYLADAEIGADGEKLVSWTESGWQHLCELPYTLSFHTFDKQLGHIAVDVESDRLIMLARAARQSIALESLEIAVAQVPLEGPVATPSANEEDAPELVETRPAQLVVVPEGDRRLAPHQTPWFDTLPEGFSLVATVPLGDKAAIVTVADKWWDDGYELHRLGGPGARVLLVDEEVSLSVLVDNELCTADFEPFQEALYRFRDEEGEFDQTEVFEQPECDHAAPDGGTKVGGYPTYMQNELEGSCDQCGQALEFAFQLASDIFESRFGDYLYVFVCPDGCTAQAANQYT